MTEMNNPPDPDLGPDQEPDRALDQDQDQNQESAVEPERVSQDVSPDYAPVAAPDFASGTYPGVAPNVAPPKVKRKRSISTPALYSTLLILGLVIGLGGGYAVQYERTPTPLPPLAAAQPKYPQSALFTGQVPVLLPAGQDDASITDGNLLAVLLPTPSDSTAVPGYDHTWLTLAENAANCTDQASCLSSALTDGVSRIAQTLWTKGKHEYAQITITQYFPGYSDKTASDFTDYQNGGDGTESLPSPTGTGAQGYSYADQTDTGTTDYMVAMHGDLLIEFLVWTDTAPAPDTSYIDSLVTQQLARL